MTPPPQKRRNNHRDHHQLRGTRRRYRCRIREPSAGHGPNTDLDRVLPGTAARSRSFWAGTRTLLSGCGRSRRRTAQPRAAAASPPSASPRAPPTCLHGSRLVPAEATRRPPYCLKDTWWRRRRRREEEAAPQRNPIGRRLRGARARLRGVWDCVVEVTLVAQGGYFRGASSNAELANCCVQALPRKLGHFKLGFVWHTVVRVLTCI